MGSRECVGGALELSRGEEVIWFFGRGDVNAIGGDLRELMLGESPRRGGPVGEVEAGRLSFATE